MPPRGAVILLIAMPLVWACSGCQGKFTRQRYETIYASMPDWQVRNVLGEPAGQSPRKWTYIHQQPYYHAEIRFAEDGLVSGKSWSIDRAQESTAASPN